MARRLYARGLANLGQAIDERVKQNTNKLVYPRDLGQAIPAPQSGAGVSGGGEAGSSSVALTGPVIVQLNAGSVVQAQSTQSAASSPTATRPFAACVWPSGAAFASVTAQPQLGMDFTNLEAGLACAYFSWTSVYDGEEGIATGSGLGLGFALAKVEHTGGVVTTRIVLKARVQVNAPQRFSHLYLALNDVGDADAAPVNSAQADVLPGLSSGQWAEVVLDSAGTDVSVWGSQLRASLIALGTEDAADAGATSLAMDWLRAELWPV